MIKRMEVLRASRFKRVLAIVVDSLIVAILAAYLSFIFRLLPNAQQYLLQPLVRLLIVTLCSLLYFSFFESSRYKATPGKILFRFYISTTNGESVTFFTAATRWLLYTVPSLPLAMAAIKSNFNPVTDYASSYNFITENSDLYAGTVLLLLIWYVPVFFTQKRQCAYELLTSTMVCIPLSFIKNFKIKSK